MKSLFIILLLLASSSANARDCNIMSPSFIVDGKEQWNDQTAIEIFNKQNKITLARGRKGSDQGVHLKTLIEPFAKQGMLVAVNCSGKSLSLSANDLFSDDPSKSDYVLILSRNGFFKIMTGEGSQPALKKINQIKFITQQ